MEIEYEFVAEFNITSAPLSVVRFRYTGELSQLHRLSVLVHVRDLNTALTPEDMVGARCSLRLTTLAEPATRCVHGVVVEAEELGTTEAGVLYQIRAEAPLVRARYRVRSQVFVDKTTRQIIEQVLTADPLLSAGAAPASDTMALGDPYTPAAERFAWRLHNSARVDDVTVRPYCVQYGESDLDFVQRLLEEEGINYHFEHCATAVTVVFSDTDSGCMRLDPFEPLGPKRLGRQLGRVRLGSRMRPASVKLTAFDWQKPKVDLTASVETEDIAGNGFVVAHPGNYASSAEHGASLATAMLDRFQSEARYMTAEGDCRLLDAGVIFKLDHPVARYCGEYLITKTDMCGRADGELPPGHELLVGSAEGPFHVRVECARRGHGSNTAQSHYRPARRTPLPRIRGTQTAIVTDDPDTRGAEIHVGGPPGQEQGCVRLRFHWDIDTQRHAVEPTSCWVRVSQALAGAGGGAVWHPRVGTEVIVDFLDGDPSRPIVVGRVYNGEQPAAAKGAGAATVSVFKSLSSPGGEVCNEFGFDDTAGSEKVNLHAGKDWVCTVGNDRTETIDNNSVSSVAVDRYEDTGANRDTSVGGNNDEAVMGDETITVAGNQTLQVGAAQKVAVASTRALSVAGAHTVTTGPESYTVKGTQSVSVASCKTEEVAAAYDLKVGAAMTVQAGAAITVAAGASYGLSAPVCTVDAPVYRVNTSAGTVTGADVKIISSGTLLLQGADVTISAGGTITVSAAVVNLKGGTVNVEGGTTNVAGGTTNVTGGSVNVN